MQRSGVRPRNCKPTTPAPGAGALRRRRIRTKSGAASARPTPLRRLALVFAWLATACAPVVLPAGPPVGEARLAAAALVAPDGARLALRSWPARGPPRAVVLALHGLNDYGNAFALPAAVWSARGIATYAYDQRGFGASPGTGLWAGGARLAQDARMAVALVAARHPGLPVFLLGDSMGGAVAVLAAAEAPPALSGLVLVAPAVWGQDSMPWSYRAALWLVAHVAPWARFSGDGLDIRPSDNQAMLRELAADPLIIRETRADALLGLLRLMDAALAAAARVRLPTLVAYGGRDAIVPAEPVARFAQAMVGSVTVAFYPRGYHMLLRDLAGAVPAADIAAFVLDPAAPLPSGRAVSPGALPVLAGGGD